MYLFILSQWFSLPNPNPLSLLATSSLEFHQFVANMIATMYAASGIGLAASAGAAAGHCFLFATHKGWCQWDRCTLGKFDHCFMLSILAICSTSCQYWRSFQEYRFSSHSPHFSLYLRSRYTACSCPPQTVLINPDMTVLDDTQVDHSISASQLIMLVCCTC